MDVFASLHSLSDIGLFALRFGIGIIFVFHGNHKRAMWKMEPSEQLPAGLLKILRLLSICEPLGGIAMIFGFLTQLAALGLGIIMLGAINLKANKMKQPFAGRQNAGWEFDFILLAGCVSVFFSGAGSIALDRMLFGL